MMSDKEKNQYSSRRKSGQPGMDDWTKALIDDMDRTVDWDEVRKHNKYLDKLREQMKKQNK